MDVLVLDRSMGQLAVAFAALVVDSVAPAAGGAIPAAQDLVSAVFAFAHDDPFPFLASA